MRSALADRRPAGPEIGYWIASWARGNRYAAEAARGLADWVLAHGAPRAHLFTDVDNAASQAAARRAGFAEEGVVRGCLEYRDGRRADAVLFGRVESLGDGDRHRATPASQTLTGAATWACVGAEPLSGTSTSRIRP